MPIHIHIYFRKHSRFGPILRHSCRLLRHKSQVQMHMHTHMCAQYKETKEILKSLSSSKMISWKRSLRFYSRVLSKIWFTFSVYNVRQSHFVWHACLWSCLRDRHVICRSNPKICKIPAIGGRVRERNKIQTVWRSQIVSYVVSHVVVVRFRSLHVFRLSTSPQR